MKWLLLCVLVLLPSLVDAACTGASPTWTSTPDQASVQACVDGATSGDTINVSAGSATWTSYVLLTQAKGNLTLAGATTCSGTPLTCTDNTVITDNTPSVSGSGCVTNTGCALWVGANAASVKNISGFTFIKSANHVGGIVQITTSPAVYFQTSFRFHHNHILQASGGGRGLSTTGVYGLIDHNVFDVTVTCTAPCTQSSIQSISINGTIAATDAGYPAWQQPLTLGTENAIYVEDNAINYSALGTPGEDGLDAYSGARFVVRHNTIANNSMGHHGTDSGSQRSPVSFEVYDNHFTNNGPSTRRGWTVRGGTGVFFNNLYDGSAGYTGISLIYYRACDVNVAVQGWGSTGCDGTNWELGSASYSNILSRTCTTTGNFRFHGTTNEALGAEGATYTKYFDNAGAAESGSFGYPCRDQPGVAPGQVVTPIYGWSNTGSTIAAVDNGTANCQGHGLANYMASGRDFINNGSTPKPGYTAYTYPHPLQGEAPPPPVPDTPTGLHLAGLTNTNAVTLVWPASTDATTVGYYVLMGTTTGVYNFTPIVTRTAALALSTHSPLTQATITNLPADTYYFTVVGFSSDFTRSEYAPEVSATFTALSRDAASARGGSTTRGPLE